MMSKRVGQLVLVAAASLLLCGLVAACGSSKKDDGGSADSATVKVEMAESPQAWTFELDRTSVPAGKVTFKVENRGNFEHELMVYPQQDVSNMIPMMIKAKREGKEVDHADMIKGLVVSTDGKDELELEPGDDGTFSAQLAPGTYELGCLVVETVGGQTFSHYDKGMHATLKVQ